MPGLAQSVIGEAHKRGGIPLQDYSLYRELGTSTSVLVVADGAGSALHAEEGSRLLAESVANDIAGDCLRNPFRNLERFRSSLLSSIYKVRSNIIENRNNLDDFHSTLIVVLIGEDQSYWAHLGDGLIAFFFRSRAQADLCAAVVSPPENGESKNETFFFTNPNLEQHIRVGRVPERILGCLAVTDGMEDFIFDPKYGVKEKFCIPLFHQFLLQENNQDQTYFINSVLTDERTNAYTNDDKSLALFVDIGARDIKGIREQFFFDKQGSPIPIEPNLDAPNTRDTSEEIFISTQDRLKKSNAENQRILSAWNEANDALEVKESNRQKQSPLRKAKVVFFVALLIIGCAAIVWNFYPGRNQSNISEEVINKIPRTDRTVTLDNKAHGEKGLRSDSELSVGIKSDSQVINERDTKESDAIQN